MVATTDVGRLAAQLLQQNWIGPRIVELEGPRRVSPKDLAAGLARALGRSVVAAAVPRDRWKPCSASRGMRHPAPYARARWLQRGLDRIRGAAGARDRRSRRGADASGRLFPIRESVKSDAFIPISAKRVSKRSEKL